MSGVGENISGTTTDFLNLNAAVVVHNGDSGHHQEGEQSNPIRDDEPDDEDPREREAFEIEKAVMQFVDEPSIRHDEYPDNDSDEDEEVVRERQRNRNTYIPGDGNLYMHQTFFSGIAFKDAVLDYALKTARNIQQYRYDKDKLGYKCVGGGCVWRIYCSVTGKSSKWSVKVFKDVHTCIPNGECEMVKVPIIARLWKTMCVTGFRQICGRGTTQRD